MRKLPGGFQRPPWRCAKAGSGGSPRTDRQFVTMHARSEPSRAATPRSSKRMFESEHVTARREQHPCVAPCQQIHQRSFIERRDGPAHNRGDTIALEITHKQIGSGGQVRDGPRPLGRDAVTQPLADCLAAHAEEARHLGLAQTPHLERACERLACTPAIEAFGKGVKPCAFMPVRGEYLLGCFFRASSRIVVALFIFQSSD